METPNAKLGIHPHSENGQLAMDQGNAHPGELITFESITPYHVAKTPEQRTRRRNDLLEYYADRADDELHSIIISQRWRLEHAAELLDALYILAEQRGISTE